MSTTAFSPSLKILSYTARGTVIPHTMLDLQAGLIGLGHEVYVQDLVSLPSFGQQVIAILDGLVALQPDLVMTMDRVALLPHCLAELEGPDHIVSWYFDNPFLNIDRSFECIKHKYHIFSWDRAYLPALEKHGFRHVYYQPLATNPRIYRPSDKQAPHYDVSFVGTFSPKRWAVLRSLADKGVSIALFGDEVWGKLPHPRIAFHGFASNREACPVIYARSKINLNITNEQLITAIPLRVFDVLACKGFLLTDEREDIDRLFERGKDLVCYKNEEDLYHKVRYYLDHPLARHRISQRGFEHVVREYTFEKVLPDMLRRVLASKPKAYQHVPVFSKQRVRALLLVGLSYLKFGYLKLAHQKFLTALALAPQSTLVLAVLAFFAHRVRQYDTVRDCAERLKHLKSTQLPFVEDLLRNPSQKSQKKGWNSLYRGLFPKLEKLESDGSVGHAVPIHQKNMVDLISSGPMQTPREFPVPSHVDEML